MSSEKKVNSFLLSTAVFMQVDDKKVGIFENVKSYNRDELEKSIPSDIIKKNILIKMCIEMIRFLENTNSTKIENEFDEAIKSLEKLLIEKKEKNGK